MGLLNLQRGLSPFSLNFIQDSHQPCTSKIWQEFYRKEHLKKGILKQQERQQKQMSRPTFNFCLSNQLNLLFRVSPPSMPTAPRHIAIQRYHARVYCFAYWEELTFFGWQRCPEVRMVPYEPGATVQLTGGQLCTILSFITGEVNAGMDQYFLALHSVYHQIVVLRNSQRQRRPFQF